MVYIRDQDEEEITRDTTTMNLSCFLKIESDGISNCEGQNVRNDK